jgi:hypothetical protein
MITRIANSAYPPCEINLRFAYNGSGRVVMGSRGSGPPTSERGSGRAKKPTLPCFGIDNGGTSRRHRHRVSRVCGLRRCRERDGVCAGHCPRRWTQRPDGWAVLPRLLRRPVVLRRRLGPRRRHLASTSPNPPWRRRWYRRRRYRSRSLSKVPYHPRNQGVSNVLP